MKKIGLVCVALVLSSCGGGDRFGGDTRAPQQMAFGPLSRACLQSDRRARSPALCGCIQSVANDTLSRSEQRRAVGFYTNPHAAQEVRQSDRPSDRTFWRNYIEYATRAERICSP